MEKKSDLINSERTILLLLIPVKQTRQFFWYVEELDPKSPAPPPPKLQVDNDTILTNTLDTAMSLNEFFSNIVSIYLPQGNTSAPNYDKLKSYIDSKISDEVNFDIPPISYDFVLKVLSSLHSKKAFEADGLSTRLLKLTAKLIATAVTMIINLSISCTKFPTAWKLGTICPIFKSGKETIGQTTDQSAF